MAAASPRGIAIASGKGGAGKSTVAVDLPVALLEPNRLIAALAAPARPSP
jgi:MinD superfamily P-loop ATPase